jgi:hypothetical protein|tara:strand:- start:952 stop:2472 length:1521 start_codon:yes stop_codon:yes gene_type:complete
MGAIKLVKLNKFYGGMSDDIRQDDATKFSISKHFDIFSNPNRLTPYRQHEADITFSDTSTDITEFALQYFLTTGSTLYGLGAVNQDFLGRLRVVEKTSLPTGDWSLSGTGTQTDAGSVFHESGIIYKDYIYVLRTSPNPNKGRLFKYGALSTGARTMNLNFGSDPLTTDDTTLSRYGRSTLGKDDRCYFAYENTVASTDGSTVSDADIQVPTDYNIKVLSTWKKFLVIGCTHIDNTDSKIYLWDYVSDDIDDVIDLGIGRLKVLGNIDDVLVVITEKSGGSLSINPIAEVKLWAGGAVQVLPVNIPLKDESGFTYTVNDGEIVDSSKLYFAIDSGLGTDLTGIYVVGRNVQGRWVVTMDRRLNNTTGVNQIDAIRKVGEFWWISHTPSENTVERTNDQEVYTTAILESQKIGSSEKDHQSIALAINHVALTSGQTMVVKYRANEESSWTTIMTSSKVDSLSKEATMEIDQNRNLKNFREMQFRLESTGGAEITGFLFKYRELDSTI